MTTSNTVHELHAVPPKDDCNLYPSPGNPIRVADRLLEEVFTLDGHYTLLHWKGDFYRYNNGAWKLLENDLDVKEPLWERLSEVHYVRDGAEREWSPTPSKVANLLEPLAIRTRIDDDEINPPTWLDNTDTSAGRTIALTNGVFELATRNLYPHTPRFFSPWKLPFGFDPDAKCPRWQQFLQEVFAHDPKGADLLQEFAGYLISGETNLQKCLLMIGPPGSGKGVMSYVLNELMGPRNTATTTLHDLTGEFGMAPLIGKPLTVIEDARGEDIRRQNVAVERLLTIIGNDTVPVNRKNNSYWVGRLNTRIALFSNEIPRLKDSSGAIMRRLAPIRLTKKFAGTGREDPHLKDRLQKELSGIFLWALDGLERLHRNGQFTETDTATEIQDTMSDMSSPLSVFIDESRFEITGDPEDFEPLAVVHRAYRVWSEERKQKPMNQDTFSQQLQAAFTEVAKKHTKPRQDVPKNRYLFGIKENPSKPFNL